MEDNPELDWAPEDDVCQFSHKEWGDIMAGSPRWSLCLTEPCQGTRVHASLLQKVLPGRA